MTPPVANKNSRPPDPARRITVSGLEVTVQNSTANRFLAGAARKARYAWMNSPLVQRDDQTQTTALPTPEPSASAPAPAAPPAPASPASPAPPPMPDLPSSHQNLASFHNNQSAIASPAPTAPRNAVTRLQTLPSSTTIAQQKQNPENQETQKQGCLEQQSVSSLPSPDPTIPPRSHTSPIVAVERNGGPIASPSMTAFPSPPLQQHASNQRRPQPNGSTVGTFPASIPSNQQANSSATRQGYPRFVPFSPPGHSHPAPTAPVPTPPLPQQHTKTLSQTLASDRPSVITAEFFVRAKRNLDAFVAKEKRSLFVHDGVEAPRLQLLDYALTHQDLIFLALHQVYCLDSYDSAQLKNLPGFGPEHVKGLYIVRNLLVDNQRVASNFLQWCVEFPSPLSELLKDWKYHIQFQGMLRLLADLVTQWPVFEDIVRTKGHPPLLDDLRSLGVMSMTLQFNIFLCLSRRIPGVKAEGSLREIFLRDFDYYMRRLSGPISIEQRRRENEEITSMYYAAIATARRDSVGADLPRIAGVAHGVSRPGQTVPTPVSAPPNLHFVQHHSPHMQSHLAAGGRNGMAPASARSSLSATPSLLPGQSVPQQPDTQQRGSEPWAQSGQAISPIVATTPQAMMPRESHQGRLVQQYPQQPSHSQSQPQLQQLEQLQQPQQSQRTGSQNKRLVLGPLPQSQMVAGHRTQSPNLHYATLLQTQPRQLQQQAARQPFWTPLLPPPNAPPVINTRPNPNRLAIHQAYLRDPINRFISGDGTGTSETELLPHMTSFFMKPKILRQEDGAVTESISLSGDELNRRASYRGQGKGERLLRTVKEGSQTYRLRCIKAPQSAVSLNEHSWCVAETAWPTAIYVHINNIELFPRRKIHNTRDLPVDITLVLQEGLNKIEVNFILGPAEQKNFTYAVAVEVLTFRSLAPAKALAQPLPAAESQKRIQAKLALKPDEDGDELSIVSDDLKVSLVDPYTARIFAVPVRGRHCDHTECFDHETFLGTRLLKSGFQSAIVADWKCPICGRDARPQNLIVDGFLADVRNQLERTNQYESARALKIRADGTWDVVTDNDTSSSEQRISRTALKRKSSVLHTGIQQRIKVDRSASAPVPERTPDQSPEVIVLD
ncbi:MIZ zinc finger domain protein [Aspergillus foveolatus]|uniref:MIZ zinc finger domain protein n=1 Tax=Aspergillus foveolatus TaxID=210207 RepID=UPI003CCD9328